MPPSGPRTRSNQPQQPPQRGNVRNEAFESIFGRPAGGHHMSAGGGPGPGPAGGPPPGAGYGYGTRPTGPYMHAPNYPPGSGTYPGQGAAAPPLPMGAPSFPPQQPQPSAHAYASQPPLPPIQQSQRQDAWPGSQSSHGHGQAEGSYRMPSQQYTGYGQQPNVERPDRRASLAPSTYSSSSASFYSPTPDALSPATGSVRRMPSANFPAPFASNGNSLTPAQAYQASTGYNGTNSVPSPASATFPHRATPPSANTTGIGIALTTPSNYSSSLAPSVSPESSRSTPQRRPTLDLDTRTRYGGGDDHLRSMESLAISEGSGFLGDIPGIPRRGDDSPTAKEFSTLAARFSGEFGKDGAALTHRRTDTRGSMSSSGHQSMHKRMASDSSITSSSAYTMRNMGPLSQINPSPTSPTTFDATSPETPTGSDGGYALGARLLDRKSVDSTQSLPTQDLPPGAAPVGTYDARATSFSGSTSARREALAAIRSGSAGPSRRQAPTSGIPTPLPSNRSLHGTLNRSNSSVRHVALASMPTIYPALLSKVAEVFRQLVNLSEHVKDGITYKDSFDGRVAVTVISEIIKTSDRNLALLLGRALDAQKMFHDVTYDHRLRDNPTEVYQFKERLAAPYLPPTGGAGDSPMSEHGILARNASSSSNMHVLRQRSTNDRGPGGLASTPESTSLAMSDSQFSFQSTNATPATSLTSLAAVNSATSGGIGTSTGGLKPPYAPTASGGSVPTSHSHSQGAEEDEDDLPVGVFTLLTDCYSPTCSRESLCYSINCPRRLEQMKRLNMKPTGLNRTISEESIKDVKETGTLWIHSVSQEILDSTSDTEKKRQEAINEVIYTERDFVRDLEYLKESWVKPLLQSDVIPSSRREDFVRQVFWNVHDVWSTNQVLAERLTKRQKQQPVVQAIGDIFLERVKHLEPFVAYGAHQLFGKWEFEKEKGANPAFQKFVDETERKPESRKLELNGYLTKPTTRLGRYPLLLEAVLKYTADDHQDKKDLPEVIKGIRAYLTKVNEESGKSENIFELAQVEGQLVFRPNEHIDLRLRDKNRELVNKGPLKRRGGNRDEIADLIGFLFDHAFLLVKPKYVNKAEQLRVYRRPIPLELLVVYSPDEVNTGRLSSGTGRSRLIAGSRNSGHASGTHVPPKPESKHGYSITIVHLGKKGYSMQLWVDTYVGRKKWLEAIDKQQTVLRDRSCVFTCETITEGYFHGLRKIHCISPYDNGNRMIYGTDEGVYFSNLRDAKLREPVKVINLLDVTQVDVIEDFQLLVVLHERSVTTFPLDCLDPNDPNAALKRGKRISSHTSFFKTGVCLGKMLVAVVKSSTLSSTIKVLEPVDQAMRGKMKQGSFMKRLNGGNEALKLFKEFYIPTESSSVHFLKTKLCVGCTKGFEIVDLETLDMQGLLDPSDQSLDFVLKRDNVRPIAIYRIEEDFLLCYDEFAFYVNKNGWRSKPKWAIIWEGMPTAFALQYPYVIAFEPSFVEVRSVHTGDLVQIIPGNNIRCLFADTPPSRINAAATAPNRQMMFPPNAAGGGSFRVPSGGAGGFPPYGQGAGYPRPPPNQMAGFMPPPAPGVPPPPRFLRDQIIFTSDDGHVQFLKLPAGNNGNNINRRGSSAAASIATPPAASPASVSQSHSQALGFTNVQPPLPPHVVPPLPPQHGRPHPHLPPPQHLHSHGPGPGVGPPYGPGQGYQPPQHHPMRPPPMGHPQVSNGYAGSRMSR